VKVAVTELAALNVRAQAEVPVQAPDHPVKLLLEDAVSVSVTCVPGAKLALHVPGQLMPAGELLTVPLPVPARVTATTSPVVKFAVTFSAPVTVNLQVVPVQPPLQPPK